MEGADEDARSGVAQEAAVLSFISRAARFVNVTARMFSGGTPFWTSQAILRTIVSVLPVPGPATTRSGPSVVVTAFCWASFRPSNMIE